MIFPLCLSANVNSSCGDWSDWSVCSTTCGGGTKTRSRSCDTPIPEGEGLTCLGLSVESETCNINDCPGTFNVSLQQFSSVWGTGAGNRASPQRWPPCKLVLSTYCSKTPRIGGILCTEFIFVNSFFLALAHQFIILLGLRPVSPTSQRVFCFPLRHRLGTHARLSSASVNCGE